MHRVILRLRHLLLLAACAASCAAAPVISEIMASNRKTLADAEGDYSDWIELHNPDSTALDLGGWHLTDNAARKTKWQFPRVTIPAGGYLVVFASDKDRRDPAAPLHTNFALSADGEYLALVAADGVTVVSEFAPAFPTQTTDVAYGISRSGAIGYLETPTPGAANAPATTSTLALARPDGTTEAFTSALPILVLDNNGFGAQTQPDGEREGSLRLLSAGATFTSPAGLKVRGSSSADFPKKSYSIELHDEAGSNRSAALLGMAKVADWALVSPWGFDPAYLRNAYMYALSNSIGRWAPRTRFTEAFFRTDDSPLGADHYHGIALLTERIKVDSELVDLEPLGSTDVSADAVTGGYLLKIDPKDDDEFGWTTDRGIPEGIEGGTFLVVASPKAARLADEQRDYIQGYVQAFENALFADRDAGWATRDYLGYIDRASWVDFHLLQVLAKNPDGLARSAYFTKDRGGKLKAGPVWDFDRALGSIDVRSEAWNEWSEPTDATQLWANGWWGVLANDPDFMQAWIDRWQSLRRGALATERLVAMANRLAAEIDPAAAARDAARWPDNASRFGDHRGEVDHLIAWLSNRANWIDRQFIAPAAAVGTASGIEISAPAGLLVAYTLDGSDPRDSGGAVSTSAILAAGTVALPAGATATVRIYHPSGATAMVSSAWSSPTLVKGATESAPETPASASQLAILHTRATLASPTAALVTGFVVPGSEAKTFILRATGKTLTTFGTADALLDPVLRVLSAEGDVLATNSDWRASPDAAALPARFTAAGAFPLEETSAAGRDAALVLTLPPGRYAMEISSESGASGTVLAEVYAADTGSNVKQFSARSALVAGESFFSGLSVTGTEARTLLIRTSGGADPALTVFSGAQPIAFNDDWDYAPNAADIATAALRSGSTPFAAGSREAAALLRVAPGAYTVRVTAGVSAPAGVQLEIVELP